jgi:hypothetical protein
MRKLQLIIYLILLVNVFSFAQSIQSISPDSSVSNSYIFIKVKGIGTHFSQASNTVAIGLNNNYNLLVINPIASSDTIITGYVNIPTNTPSGMYNVNVFNVIDGNMLLPASFLIATSPANLYSVYPQKSTPGQHLQIRLNCQNTNFVSGVTTQVWFSNGSYTIHATNVQYLNSNQLVADLEVNVQAPIGLYQANFQNPIDGIITKANAFELDIPTNITGEVFPNKTKIGKTINVYASTPLYSFGSEGGMFYRKGNSILQISPNINQFYIVNYGSLQVPNNADTGFYDLIIADGVNICQIENALQIVENSSASIDSAILYNFSIFDVYGSQTHFTDTNLIIEMDNANLTNNGYDSIQIIDDEHLKIFGFFAFFSIKADYYYPNWIKIYNGIDDTISTSCLIPCFSAIKPLNNNFSSINVYPNPFQSNINIESAEFKNQSVITELWTIDGMKLLEKTFMANSSIQLDGSSLKPGIYLLKISAGNQSSSLRIVKLL